MLNSRFLTMTLCAAIAVLFLTQVNVGSVQADLIAKEISKSPVNANCPIMGHKVTKTGGRTVWKEQTIGFCCPGCIKKWNALSETEKATKLAKAGKAQSDQTPTLNH